MNDTAPTATPGGRRQRLFVLGYIVVLVAAALGTAIWGWLVVRDVRETARRTDAQMRLVAWSIMTYACENDGAFPTSDEALRSIAPAAEIECRPVGEATWPLTIEDAMGEHVDVPSLADSLESVAVIYGESSILAPVLDPVGKPTRLGTIPSINQWLRGLADRFAIVRELEIDEVPRVDGADDREPAP